MSPGQRRIFRRFYRIDRISRHTSGVGSSPSSSRLFARTWRTVEVASAPGKAQHVTIACRSAPEDGHETPILLIEDEPALAAVCRTHCANGFEVAMAGMAPAGWMPHSRTRPI
jgi:hypothetical protein